MYVYEHKGSFGLQGIKKKNCFSGMKSVSLHPRLHLTSSKKSAKLTWSDWLKKSIKSVWANKLLYLFFIRKPSYLLHSNTTCRSSSTACWSHNMHTRSCLGTPITLPVWTANFQQPSLKFHQVGMLVGSNSTTTNMSAISLALILPTNFMFEPLDVSAIHGSIRRTSAGVPVKASPHILPSIALT